MMEKKKRPSKSRAAKPAARKSPQKTYTVPAQRTRPVEAGVRSAIGLYVGLLAVGVLLIWLFRSVLPGSMPPTAVRSTPAVIAPTSAPAPMRRAPQAAVPVPAPEPQPTALASNAPVREFWTWNYAEGVT